MKISRFTTKIELDDAQNMLYNTASRQYYVYSKDDESSIQNLLDNINSGVYGELEIQQIAELLRKKIIVSNEVDEIAELEYRENTVRYQDSVFHIMIIVTNACNFRCTYCIQKHESKTLDDVSENKIIRLLSRISEKTNKISIAWFGGEPLLQFQRIERMILLLKNICEKNHCILENTMTTNGYLLNGDIVKHLGKLNFKQLQVTIDGDRKTHDSRRYQSNGKGTYDEIVKNLHLVLTTGITIILRINVDEENIEMAESILVEFPKEYRENIVVSIANFYQEDNKISVRHIYEKAIKLGYQYAGRWNRFAGCQVCYKNGIVVDTNAKIIVCANAVSEGELGYIDDDGNLHIENVPKYCKLKTVSALQNPECRDCLELPFCIATCKFWRLKDNTLCVGKRADGMSIEDMAKLDYLYDNRLLKGKVECQQKKQI